MVLFMVIGSMNFSTKASSYNLLPSNGDENTSVKINTKRIFHGNTVVMVTKLTDLIYM